MILRANDSSVTVGDAPQKYVAVDKHVPALDGIRGLAILLILCVHLLAANSNTGSHLLNMLYALVESCFVGVNLFFVLSGFLITGILIDTVNLPNFFRIFYARRALRIFPLYYGVLIVLFILTRPMHLDWGVWRIPLLTYTSNLEFWRAKQLIPLAPFNINHFWSLQVEEQFYLFWPLVVYRLREPGKILRVAAVGCVVIFLVRLFCVFYQAHIPDPYVTYSSTFCCADNLLYGCMLAAISRAPAMVHTLRYAERVFAVASLLVVALLIHYHGLQFQTNKVVPTVGFFLVAVACTALIAMSLRVNSFVQRLFSSSFLRFFGKYSYGIYVFHYTITGTLGNWFRQVVDMHHSKAIGVLSGAALSLAASVLLAMLSYRFYELPFINLKRHFPYKKTPVIIEVAA